MSENVSGDHPEQLDSQTARFSSEARKALEEKGYTILTLRKRSIAELIKKGSPIFSSLPINKDGAAVLEEPSRAAEVALNPSQLFLPNSGRKAVDDQKKMIARFSKELGIKDTEAVLGSAADYVDLAMQYLDSRKVKLFGENYNLDYTRTSTHLASQWAATVGHFTDELDVNSWATDSPQKDIFVCPLIVPSTQSPKGLFKTLFKKKLQKAKLARSYLTRLKV